MIWNEVMDKILLTAFLTALAGFITAALSIVKLVNEKESKTTEFRQAWTQSARSALADLVAKINAHVSAMVYSKNVAQGLVDNLRKLHSSDNEAEKELLGNLTDHQHEMNKKAIDRVRDLGPQVQQAYALARLHFKINDPEFMKIENKYDFYMGQMAILVKEENDREWSALQEQVNSATLEMTVMSRGLLKTEWEKVKQGEPAYKKTKKWSVWFCVLMLFVLLTIGAHAYFSYKDVPISPARQNAAETQANG